MTRATAVRAGVGLFLAGALVLIGAISLERLRRSGTWPPSQGGPAEAPLPVLWPAPEFSLPERGGGTIRTADLRGKLWVADFVFTRCQGQCGRLSAEMKRLQDDEPDLTLVSFSVDPEHDTPEALAAYAKERGADPKRWLFLTGDRPTLWALSFEGFKLTVGDNPSNEREPIAHDPRLQLVDRQGRVRGQYSVNEPEQMEALRRDLARLRAER